jgi:hypothetical protein
MPWQIHKRKEHAGKIAALRVPHKTRISMLMDAVRSRTDEAAGDQRRRLGYKIRSHKRCQKQPGSSVNDIAGLASRLLFTSRLDRQRRPIAKGPLPADHRFRMLDWLLLRPGHSTLSWHLRNP